MAVARLELGRVCHLGEVSLRRVESLDSRCFSATVNSDFSQQRGGHVVASDPSLVSIQSVRNCLPTETLFFRIN